MQRASGGAMTRGGGRSLLACCAWALALAGVVDAAKFSSKQSMHPAPGSILNLKHWLLQTPSIEKPVVRQPEVRKYSSNTFYVKPQTNAVVMTTNADGGRIGLSNDPRTELREAPFGQRAYWSLLDPKPHTMVFSGAVHALSPVGKSVLIAQVKSKTPNSEFVVHVSADKSGRPVVATCVRFRRGNGNKMYKQHGLDEADRVLEPRYVLGTKYTIKLVAHNGTVSVYFNDMRTPATVFRAPPFPECYFKVGNYLQCSPCENEPPGAKSEVRLYSLQLYNPICVRGGDSGGDALEDGDDDDSNHLCSAADARHA